MKLKSIFIIVGFALCSCATVDSAITEPVNWSTSSSDKSATIECSPKLKIISMDGDRQKEYSNRANDFVGTYKGCILKVDPGKHSFVVQFNASPYTSGDVYVEADFVSGGKYHFKTAGQNGFVQRFSVSIERL